MLLCYYVHPYFVGPLNDPFKLKAGVTLPLSRGPVIDGVKFINFDDPDRRRRSTDSGTNVCFEWAKIDVSFIIYDTLYSENYIDS